MKLDVKDLAKKMAKRAKDGEGCDVDYDDDDNGHRVMRDIAESTFSHPENTMTLIDAFKDGDADVVHEHLSKMIKSHMKKSKKMRKYEDEDED